MTPSLIASVGHGSTAFWYLTRSTGLVALLVLSSTVVLGIIASVGWTTERWPRFLSQSVHRNLSLFCVTLVVVHVVTTVADGYVPIGFADAVIPFRSPYRPIWVGLGAVGFDIVLAVGITSGLRRYIGARAWRSVHWLAYACWPIALVHGLGSGSDTRLPGTLVVYVLCVIAVVAAAGWRLVTGRGVTPGLRIGAAACGVFVLFAIGVFALLGPLQPGWSKRSGTSSALLTQLSPSTSVPSTSSPTTSSTSPSVPSTTGPVTSGVPAVPFSSAVSGTFAVSGPNAAGLMTVNISLQLQSDGLPLVVTLFGPAVDGGVSMTSSRVTLGPEHGVVTSLAGTTIGAEVQGAGTSLDLTLQLNLDRSTGAATGTVSAVAGGRGNDEGVGQ